MAAEHTHDGRDGGSVSGIGWLLILVTLFILLIVNSVMVIFLLDRLRSDDEERPSISVASTTQPPRPTFPMTAVVEQAQTFTLSESTLAPTRPLKPPDARSESPMLVISPTSYIPTATPLPITETPFPTATPLLPAETPEPTAKPFAEISSPLEEGWHGEYFANMLLAGNPVLGQDSADLAFNWGYSSPVGGVPADQFSARWERALNLPSGVYQFYVHADDGVRVWVDSLLLVNEWHEAVDMTYAGQVTLRSGNHKIKVEYFEDEGTAEIQFWWEGPDSYSDWRGEYWSNPNLSGEPNLVRNDEAIDFNWGRNSPDDELPRNEFSACWTRLVTFEEGIFRFRATVDDGLRLYIDDDLVIYEWRDGEERDISTTYHLTSGTHFLKVEYYESKGVASIHLWWEKEVNDH